MITAEEKKNEIYYLVRNEVSGATFDELVRLLDQLAEISFDEGIEYARENPATEPEEDKRR